MTTKAQLAQYCADHFPVHNITGVTLMHVFYIATATFVVGGVFGWFVKKLGFSTIVSDVKADFTPTAVVTPVVATPLPTPVVPTPAVLSAYNTTA